MASTASKLRPLEHIGPTWLDWSAVEAVIASFGSPDDKREKRFQLYCLNDLFSIAPIEAEYHITDDGFDRGVDCLYLDRDTKTLNILNTKTVKHFHKARHNFPGSEIEKLITFLTDFLTKDERLTRDSNPLLARKVLEAWEALEDPDYKINVYICSNQAPLCQKERNRLTAKFASPKIAIFERHLEDIANGLTTRISKPITRDVVFHKGCSYEYHSDGVRLYQGLITTEEVVQLATGGTGVAIDSRLFASNVRFDLGAENEINKSIRAALMEPKNTEFVCLNNGITVVCDQIISAVGSAFPIRLKNPQIVNGCQTVHAVVDVYRTHPGHVSQATVSVKIIEAGTYDFADRIAIASNSQTRILPRDLRANDSRQFKLAESLRACGYFYRRKKGETYDGPKDREIDAHRTGQLLLAYVNGEPDKAKTKSETVFDDLYDRVFDPGIVTPQLVLAVHQLHEEVYRQRIAALRQQRESGQATYDEVWIVEGAFHVLYVVGELCRRTNIELADISLVLKQVPRAIELVERFFLATNQAAYRVFRLARTKDALDKILDREFADSPLVTPSRPIQLDMLDLLLKDAAGQS
jgi:hypothetical protein